MNRVFSTLKGGLEWGLFAGLVVGYYGAIAIVTTGREAYSRTVDVRNRSRRRPSVSLATPREE
ncbi:hypothetical protein [Halalkalicoccus tibetensis]|uniref:Uncharacterized protein n=1 Tax=Halalkalicoccus tibetensis TaxID=175632 RepID=A0ABD5V2T4_9EURY